MVRTRGGAFKAHLEPLIRLLGMEEVIRQIGLDRIIDQVGPKKVIDHLGLDRLLANLTPVQRQELKRRLQ